MPRHRPQDAGTLETTDQTDEASRQHATTAESSAAPSRVAGSAASPQSSGQTDSERAEREQERQLETGEENPT